MKPRQIIIGACVVAGALLAATMVLRAHHSMRADWGSLPEGTYEDRQANTSFKLVRIGGTVFCDARFQISATSPWELVPCTAELEPCTEGSEESDGCMKYVLSQHTTGSILHFIRRPGDLRPIFYYVQTGAGTSEIVSHKRSFISVNDSPNGRYTFARMANLRTGKHYLIDRLAVEEALTHPKEGKRSLGPTSRAFGFSPDDSRVHLEIGCRFDWTEGGLNYHDYESRWYEVSPNDGRVLQIYGSEKPSWAIGDVLK